MQPGRVASGNVLLTGATGVFGSNLLKVLLETTECIVYCLVRAPSELEARERLQAFLRVYDPEDKLADEFRLRVHPVLGDVVSPQLGLSDETYREMAAKIDAIVHGAALTNLFAKFHKVEAINVGGTRNMIAFALQTRQKNLCYISTYTVSGDKSYDPNFVFLESHLDVGQGFEHMTYQQSKFIAENLVRSAGEAGLQWKIIRPGQIFGESHSGFYPQGQTNVSGLFYDIFKTVIETGVALHSNVFFDVTPVDYVSKATAYLALYDNVPHQTYHLTNPDERSYSEVIRTLSDFGYPIAIVPQDEYKKLLFGRHLIVDGSEYKSYTTQAFKWWYRRENFDFRYGCRTDCTATRLVLEAKGIRCPKLDHELLGVYIDHGIRQNYFPKARTLPRSAGASRDAASALDARRKGEWSSSAN